MRSVSSVEASSRGWNGAEDAAASPRRATAAAAAFDERISPWRNTHPGATAEARNGNPECYDCEISEHSTYLCTLCCDCRALCLCDRSLPTHEALAGLLSSRLRREEGGMIR